MTKYTKEELQEQYGWWCEHGLLMSAKLRAAEEQIEWYQSQLHEAQQMQRTIAQEMKELEEA